MNQDAVNRAVLLLMVIAISALFLSMIHQFLMAIFLAGLFSALARPIFVRLETAFKGHRHLASAVTLLLMLFVVLIPLLVLIGIVVGQAINVGEAVTPWIKQALEHPEGVSDFLKHLPFYDQLVTYREPIIEKAGKVVAAATEVLIGGLSSVTLGTVNFIFMAFVMLYTMYFLQMDGDKLIQKILYYLPLNSSDENRMLEKFVSVTRATLKGTMLIGLLQGALAGSAFAVVGIDNAVFWGTMMAALSIIPSVGSALIWLPAAIVLIAQGAIVSGVGLILFCAIVVGSLDNILRPILVGKDTKMHELMIFFGTLGGIVMFGVSGIFIGPVIASLFVTIWEIYGTAFQDVLPQVQFAAATDKDAEATDGPGPEVSGHESYRER